MKALSETIYLLDGEGIGALATDIVLHLRPFLDDERAGVRAAAIGLLESVLSKVKKTEKDTLKRELTYCLLPLILHLKDESSAVAMKCKLTLFRCAAFFQWSHQKLLFRRLVWGNDLKCLELIWECLVYAEPLGRHFRLPSPGTCSMNSPLSALPLQRLLVKERK
uniref:Maestro/Maestro-like HEAT-repeats domain-containing protein n=1 Tax=Sphenodon punctatus TaxID=8508 RepID=A0A8D0H0C3_SPHPU